MVCMCVVQIAHYAKKKHLRHCRRLSRLLVGIPLAQIEQKNGTKAQFHLTIFSPLLWLDRLLAISP